MTVRDAFEKFMLHKKVSGLTDNSLAAYRWQCLVLLRTVGDDQLEELSQDQITGVLLQIMDSGLSKATKSSYIRSMRIFLRWCSMEFPVRYRYEKIKIPRSPKKQVKVYTEQEILTIFASVVAHPEWIRLRNLSLVALLYDSGIRRAEACGLLRADLDLENHRILVTGKGDKQRFAPFGSAAAAFLREYLAACPFDHSHVFVSIKGVALSTNAVNQVFHDLQERLPFKLSPHKLRHNFATNYCLEKYAAGEAVDPLLLKALMGHEDLVTTMRYLHFAAAQMAVKDCPSILDKIIAGH